MMKLEEREGLLVKKNSSWMLLVRWINQTWNTCGYAKDWFSKIERYRNRPETESTNSPFMKSLVNFIVGSLTGESEFPLMTLAISLSLSLSLSLSPPRSDSMLLILWLQPKLVGNIYGGARGLPPWYHVSVWPSVATGGIFLLLF